MRGLDDLHPAAQRFSAGPVDVDDVGVGSRTVEDRPDGPADGHLDQVMLPAVADELDVHASPCAVYEAHLLAARRREDRRHEPGRFDDDRVVRPRESGCEHGQHHQERGAPAHHRYSSMTALSVSVSPRRQRVTAIVSPIRWRASASWKWWRSFTTRPATVVMTSPGSSPAASPVLPSSTRTTSAPRSIGSSLA